jgi:ABC-type transport system involved in Fe-S cluster assembly fused permease/ATPase subunit
LTKQHQGNQNIEISLDTENEKSLQENLKELFKGKTTTIIIAHRLSTIIDSDEIIVLQKGVIVENGKHDDLIKLNGEYKKLWEAQNENSEERKKRLNLNE